MNSSNSLLDVLQNAIAAHQAGELDQALHLYNSVLAQHPDQPDALNLMGVLTGQCGDIEQAIALFDRAMKVAPKLASAPFNKGNLLQQAGRVPEARAAYEAALASDSTLHDARINLGALIETQGDIDEALRHFVYLIQHGPNEHPSVQKAYYNAGRCYQTQGRFAEAKAAFSSALALNETDHHTHFAIANVYAKLNDYQSSTSHIEKAIQLNPDWPEAYSVFGLFLSQLGKHDQAIEISKKAIRLRPDSGAIHLNLALVYHAAGDTAASEEFLEKAFTRDELLEIDEGNKLLRHQASDVLLSSGDFERGWVDFDVRFEALEICRNRLQKPPPPYWNGEDLKGQKILVWTEQGLGEEILAATIIPDLIATGASIVLECSSRMVPVFKSAFPDITISSKDEHTLLISKAHPPFDFQYPALSLMKTFRPNISSIEAPQQLLKPNQALCSRLRLKYEGLANGKAIVGLSWRSTNEKFGREKSVLLDDLEPILRIGNVLFVNLQYGDCSAEIEDVTKRLGVTIVKDDEVDPLGDLPPLLAQIASMDLVLSVSSSNVHFGGALGVPTWAMVPEGRGRLWFWFKEREDSPWYPSVRLFRKKPNHSKEENSWAEVIGRVAKALEEWCAARAIKR